MSPPDRVPVLGILAGGDSSRFPGPGGKLAAPLDGEPMLLRLVRLLTPHTDRLVVAGRPPDDCPLPAGLEVLPDPRDQIGPLRGPLAGLLALARNAPGGFVVVAGDMPFLPPRLPLGLWNASQGAAGACLAGRDPLPLALRPDGYPDLEEHARAGRGPRHLLAALRGPNPRLRELPPPPPDDLADVDTPADLRLAREHLARRTCGAVGEPDAPPASGAPGPLLRWDS